MNNLGEVVGNCRSTTQGTYRTRAFAWKAGSLRELPVLTGDDANHASAINDSGQIVGYSAGYRGQRAVRWQDASVTLLPQPDEERSAALGINARGDVVGLAGTGDNNTALLWRGDSIIVLKKLSSAVGINGAGDVVIATYTHAWLWQTGALREIGFDAAGITDSGEVYGAIVYGRPLVWRAGVIADLGTIPMHADGAVWRMNNRGQAIGMVNGFPVVWQIPR